VKNRLEKYSGIHVTIMMVIMMMMMVMMMTSLMMIDQIKRINQTTSFVKNLRFETILFNPFSGEV
jgi:hypothetical protein